eukprot:TRINITY_DN6805_c0_g1_i1.p1 TRINITY_DN6805_c0_g1~~TRINITY_DN6805_c0_g1_i1.p1  ORF type:complete len:403 (+),score=47.42 TRINITY_DN6805_c0_g1_i1:30-1238(+)
MQELFAKNVPDIIVKIFLYLTAGELHVCRQVCSVWNEFIINEIWQSRRCRNQLKNRLHRNWLNLEFKKSEQSLSEIYNQSGIKILNGHLLLHPQVYTSTSSDHKFACYKLKTGQKIQERSLEGFIERIDLGSSFIVFGFSNVDDQINTSDDTSESVDILQVYSIPDLNLLAKITLPAEQNKELYCVKNDLIVFLRAYRQSLDSCQFVLFDPVNKERKDFIVKLSFTDVLGIQFDGRYVLVKTIGKDDKITVFDVITRQCITKGLPASEFTLNEVFRYPLSLSIEDHCYLTVFNIKTLARYKHFIHRSKKPNTEIGLLNQMFISDSGFLILSRYEKFKRTDHSNCCSQMELFNLEDLKYGIFQPVTLDIRQSGPLFDDFHLDKSSIVALYSSEKKVDLYNFWS